jgi:hypothetical protein
MAMWNTETMYRVNVEGMVVEAVEKSWKDPENALTAGCCFTKGLSSWPQSYQSPVIQLSAANKSEGRALSREA